MATIQILSDHLANQIAAGEVVERPASVVKELVENAIDADATKIEVDLVEGGISSIRISDNGIGMSMEDAKLAFERHATSKIRNERDLSTIRTLGFRGEALPSIASVARVELVTSSNDLELATTIQIDGGSKREATSTSRVKGTDVIVRDLFYNTPARLKYLKTISTEISHVADVIGRLALAHPTISFHLQHQGRELFRSTGDGKLLHAILALYGKQVAAQMVAIEAEDSDFKLSGYIGKPEVTRASRKAITILLNGRYVRSIPLTNTILTAYGTLLPVGRYPIGVFQIEMDPKLVDVNVHPAKLEVRLSKEKELAHLITKAIKSAFQQKTLIPIATPPKQTISPPKTKVEQMELSHEKPYQKLEVKQPAPIIRESSSFALPKKEVVDAKEDLLSPLSDSSSNERELLEVKSTRVPLPELLPLAQVHGTYIVAQSANGMYLIDQHAAQERIYYEKFLVKMKKEDHHVQPLLVPLTIECTSSEALLLENYLEALKDWGLELEPFGGNTFLLRSYPDWFPSVEIYPLLSEIIEWLRKHGRVNTTELRDTSAKLMACKAAIKANRHLRMDEMEALLRTLATCETPYTCPHGRPILVHFSTYELEKMFKRVM
ncbi:DNA mismatch repair endonuclease MutL [Shimazuella sp. AN120528]|uniref:DNA mismatch repair endonuclease MutL n=1 Tax=Shimazuella soli TaxID=1892854 RepID=UPI001F0DD9ED|nr:DNA mismatch repair endonuclease MutL [Shimazuella soli]MCH5586397.1 DNA mismatch repair endonuclease MutL [Shimazuella soli]